MAASRQNGPAMQNKIHEIVAELERLLNRQIEALDAEITPEMAVGYGERNM
jgi:hypothetical protein